MYSSKPIAFLLPYPLHKAPSQRFRVEQFLPVMDTEKIAYTLYPFMDMETWKVLYKGGSILQKATGIAKGYLKRWKTVLFDMHKHDIVFIHREAAPLGPPVFEWILTKIWRKKVIYDFDDAIWIPNTSSENKLASYVKAFWKVPKICKWVDTVTGGNDFLCAYARESGNKNAVRLPTVVNTVSRYNRLKVHEDNRKIVVGWTGSHSTLKYLDELMPVIQELQESMDFTFLVIADKKPDLPLKDWMFLPWNEDTEIEDLLKIDIGVMPLLPDRWSEGKCGFKLIQYLSLGIPAIATDVGVNNKIIVNNLNGYLSTTVNEWKNNLEKLITDRYLREKMGTFGREKMVGEYSVLAASPIFTRLFLQPAM